MTHPQHSQPNDSLPQDSRQPRIDQHNPNQPTPLNHQRDIILKWSGGGQGKYRGGTHVERQRGGFLPWVVIAVAIIAAVFILGAIF